MLRPVALVTSRHVLEQPGIEISQEFLGPRERRFMDGLVITTQLRSVCFEARYAATLIGAVIAVDTAAYSDAVALDENSWSPREVGMWLVWHLRGERPRPLCNVPVFDRAGRHVGTPDLLDPVAGVVGEYNSALHLVGAQHTQDVRREGEFRRLGLEHVVMLGSDHADGFASFLARLDTAHGNARHAAEATRPWTLVPPPWWIDTTTVAARRALPPELRDRALRYRRVA